MIFAFALLLSACTTTTAIANDDGYDRQYINNCGTFIGLNAPMQAIMTQAFLSGMWEGSGRGTKVETITAILMSGDDMTENARYIASQTVRLCHARLAVDGEGDVYQVMSAVVFDLIEQAEAE
jgi:hypothetical protein